MAKRETIDALPLISSHGCWMDERIGKRMEFMADVDTGKKIKITQSIGRPTYHSIYAIKLKHPLHICRFTCADNMCDT